MTIGEISEAISLVCPILGCNSDGEIWFKDEATDEQKAAARVVINENLPNLTQEGE